MLSFMENGLLMLPDVMVCQIDYENMSLPENQKRLVQPIALCVKTSKHPIGDDVEEEVLLD